MGPNPGDDLGIAHREPAVLELMQAHPERRHCETFKGDRAR
jgi:hypothetical protein